MYHGRTVPGFPRHPHRGFETVTVVRTGLLDHSDSLGARARYGNGDVQWLTAGQGINHAEMFPLLRGDQPNPFELFQIWLNLPATSKMVPPAFKMLWQDSIPRHEELDRAGRRTVLTMVAGAHGGKTPPAPPPDSYASLPDSDIAIWTIKLEPGAQWVLPPAASGSRRSLYFFSGSGLRMGGQEIPDYHRVQLQGAGAVSIEGGPVQCELLLLQGRPIGEPVARRGPFVMNTEEEIRQAYLDYRKTGFGGWPWDGDDPVHGAEALRFAQLIDGSRDQPS
jgi:redox-sensitive bicupin YhaK (pirin superfamily)